MAQRRTTDEKKTKVEDQSLGTNHTKDAPTVTQNQFIKAMMESLKSVNALVVKKRNVIARAKWNKRKGRGEESH